MQGIRTTVVMWLGMLLSLDGAALASTYSLTTIDFPGTDFTLAQGINNSGEVVGVYAGTNGFHGFLFTAGNFTTINAPGHDDYTTVQGINDSGQIVGYYEVGAGGQRVQR